MKRVITFLLLPALLIALAACSGSGNPSPPAPSPTGTVTPAPTPVPAPVTREGIPAYFTPGLAEPGIRPAAAHRIGFIAGQAFAAAALRAALDGLAGQYSNSFGVTVDVRDAVSAVEQLAAAQELIGSGIELLILSADGDRAEIGALCEQSGIPYITMDCRAGTPGQGCYVCSFERDDYLIGILTGLSIADTLGAAGGNIGEITGAVSDPACVLRSAGLRRALSAYPDIRVVCSVTTEGDTAYHAAVNVMKAFRAGELSGIVAADDAAALETLQAALNYGRDELVGRIWSAGATKDGLTAVWYGQFMQTVEVPAQTGMLALEYALQYLEGSGEDIPPVVCAVTRAFSAGSQERLDAIAALIADMDARGAGVCPDSAGDYALFFSCERVLQMYPQHCWEYADPTSYIAEFVPYATQQAVYAASSPE